MPSLITTCETLFNTQNLYEVLGVDKSADNSQIKKAYHKLSLKVHPDRVADSGRELATQKFQCLGAVYSVLSDESRRGLYDECGEVDDENDPMTQSDRDWTEYWRLLFPKITLKDIQDFEDKYRGSEEEINDIKSAYEESEGDMGGIMEKVMCSRDEDEDRYRSIIDKLIKEKKVKKFKAYTHEDKGAKAARKRAAQTEAKEAEKARKELGLDGSEASLANMIMARQQSRANQADSFLDSLAEKYGAKSSSKKKSKK